MTEEGSYIDDLIFLGLNEEDLLVYEQEVEAAYYKMLEYVGKYSKYTEVDKIVNFNLYLIAEGHIKWFESFKLMHPQEKRTTLIALLKKASPNGNKVKGYLH